MKFEGASVVVMVIVMIIVMVIWGKGEIFLRVLKLPVSHSRGCMRHSLHEDL